MRAANQSGGSEGHQSDDRHAQRQPANAGPTNSSTSPARPGEPTQATDQLKIDAGTQTVSGPEQARIFVYTGNVDARIGTYRLQADKVTVYEATNRVIAEGNVVFDQGDQQRITGKRAEWNYRTKTGFFLDSTGFTNQTEDGTQDLFHR